MGSIRLGGLRRSHLLGLGSVVMSVGLVAALVAGMVGNGGHPSSKVALSTGAAWFPSPDVGTVALVDGTTVTRVTQVRVAPAGDKIEAVQAGSSAYVLDHSTGQAVRVDGATLTAAPPVALGIPDDGHLAIRSTGEVTWAVERGGTAAQQLEPRTLGPLGPPLAFPGIAAPPVVGADGTLWLVDGPLLRSLHAGKVRTNTDLAGVGTSQLVMASRHPVVLDATNHRAIEINPSTGGRMRSACFDSADPRAQLSGSSSKTPLALAVSPTAGTLLISDLRGGGCRDVVLGDPSSQDRYGRAVESGGYVYVPDYQARTVLVVDARTGKILARPLVDPVGNAHFDLLAYHGFVWFDDTVADTAGVVTLHGATAVSTSRGDPGGMSVTLGHGPPPPPPPPHTGGGGGGGRGGGGGGPGGGGGGGGGGRGGGGGGPPPPPAPKPAGCGPISIGLNPTAALTGEAVTYTDMTTGTHSDSWNFGANSTPMNSTSNAGNVQWSLSGSYVVTLTIICNDGGAESGQQSIVILSPGTPPPVVTAIAPPDGPSGGNTRVTISGTNLTGTTLVSFAGSAGRATAVPTTISDTSVSVVTPPGSGTVDLTVTTPVGTSPTAPNDLYTYEAPVVSFVWNPTQPQAGQRVAFTDQTQEGSAYSASWTFQGLPDAAGHTAQATWDQPSSTGYQVTLTLSAGTSRWSKTNVVIVSPASGCSNPPGLAQTYTDTPVSYVESVGQFPEVPNGTPTLSVDTVTNGSASVGPTGTSITYSPQSGYHGPSTVSFRANIPGQPRCSWSISVDIQQVNCSWQVDQNGSGQNSPTWSYTITPGGFTTNGGATSQLNCAVFQPSTWAIISANYSQSCYSDAGGNHTPCPDLPGYVGVTSFTSSATNIQISIFTYSNTCGNFCFAGQPHSAGEQVTVDFVVQR